MVDTATLTQLATLYPWSSWAIWDDQFPEDGCLEQSPGQLRAFIDANRAALTPDIVLVGLNRSADLPAPFANFHAPTGKHYDYRLKEFIQDGGLDRLYGAYMTDLVDEIDPNAGAVTVSDTDWQLFRAQLRLLAQETYHIFCFGTKPFQALCDKLDVTASDGPHDIRSASRTLDDTSIELYRVWFYGAWGANQSKVEELEGQLTHLNRKLQ